MFALELPVDVAVAVAEMFGDGTPPTVPEADKPPETKVLLLDDNCSALSFDRITDEVETGTIDALASGRNNSSAERPTETKNVDLTFITNAPRQISYKSLSMLCLSPGVIPSAKPTALGITRTGYGCYFLE